MNAKQRIFKIVSAEDILGRLSLRDFLGVCTKVMTDDELEALLEERQGTAQVNIPTQFPMPDVIKEEPEPAPEQDAPKRKPRIKDETTWGLILSQKDEFLLKSIENQTGHAMSHIATIVYSMMDKGLVTRRRDPSCRRVQYLYKVTANKEAEVSPAEPPKPVPKPKAEPVTQPPRKEEPKGPRGISWRDLYDRPDVVECIYKDLYNRMHRCLENMGQYDIKELLLKNFPEFKQLYDLGPNDVRLMVAGRELLDYLTDSNPTGKIRKYDCSVIMKDSKGTYKARPSEMSRYAKAKGWGSNESI